MVVPAGLAFTNFVVLALVVAALYFTRDILVPIALAVLLSFLLAPLVRLLQRWRLPRSLAVTCTVLGALAITLSLATMVMIEVNQLVNDLPRYQATLGRKVQNLRETVGSAGLLKNASSILQSLDKELSKKDDNAVDGPKQAFPQEPLRNSPIPVEVHQPDPGASAALIALLKPLAAPFTTIGIVVIFLAFFLFQREDLRNRFIRLAGSGDLERTTAALDDAGRRLGRLFATQLVLNAIFGVVIGFGVALIGVPSAPLWGLLAMILRFVPYIGAVLAAALPISLAAAVGSDWTMTVWTVVLFAVAEPLMGQVIEPLVCGRTAGLSPVAIVVAASFWTWLWGPLGLLLSTPLTLCLVVLARHVERLQFIDVMLGDQPALTPKQAAYQRMLTGDPLEAIEQARAFLKDGTLAAYYDEILLGALRLAQADAELGRLDDVRLENIFQTVSEVVDDLAEHGGGKASSEEKPRGRSWTGGKVVTFTGGDFAKPVFCIPGLGRLDDCAVLVVADALKRAGIDARISGATTAIEDGEAALICVCYLENVPKARTDYTVRKLSRKASSARIVICLLGEPTEVMAAQQDMTPRSISAVVAAFVDSESQQRVSGTNGSIAGSALE
ncbi:AI-2E family transporter [uncultured Bradyrhizobium sp.]|uniref:AI-2E family transporter n=1 Tax=uncultured Bradyrhizobium sp. TaxID=199684 RepID=UPI0035CC733A